MNNYRTLGTFELNEIKKYLKNPKDIHDLQFFIEELLSYHYKEGYNDKGKEIENSFKLLINSKFVEKGTVL